MNAELQSGNADEVVIAEKYLYWTGCAANFDGRIAKVVQATVSILRAAGIKGAFLGEEEVCTGDPARRLGHLERAGGFSLYRFCLPRAAPACGRGPGSEYLRRQARRRRACPLRLDHFLRAAAQHPQRYRRRRLHQRRRFCSRQRRITSASRQQALPEAGRG